MENVTYADVLRQPGYRKLILANIINRLGDAIDTLAFSWIVYAFTGEGMWAAIVFGVNKISSVLFLPFAGALVEKREKKRTMITADIIRCILVAILVTIISIERLSIWVLILFAFLISMAEAFRIPASTSFITQMLNDDTRDKGVTLNVIVSTIVEIAGAAIGGILISCFSANVALLADVASFVISIVLIWSIHQKETIDTKLKEATAGAIFQDGLFYIKNSRILITVILLAVLANASFASLDALQTAIVVEIFHREADYLSVLNVVLSIGMLLGGIAYPSIRKRIRDYKLYKVSFAYIGLLYLVVALCSFDSSGSGMVYVVPVILYFFYGVAASFLATGLGLQLLENVEQSYMARVSTVYSAIVSLATPTVSFLAGILTGKIGMQPLFLTIAALILCITFLHVIQNGIKNKRGEKIEEKQN